MEPVSFADILFIFITLAITFAILWMVNKSKTKAPKTTEEGQSGPSATVVADNTEA